MSTSSRSIRNGVSGWIFTNLDSMLDLYVVSVVSLKYTDKH